MDVYNHFHEMRFKIDEQREELKKKIIERYEKNKAKKEKLTVVLVDACGIGVFAVFFTSIF
jgi:C4-type Zn-finger protein